MTDKEKLVQLINQGVEIYSDGYQRKLTAASAIADHLIAHGVTVQECGYWIKTETNSTCSKCGGNVVSWTGEYDGYERERGISLMRYCPHCGAKMVPEPPEGE